MVPEALSDRYGPGASRFRLEQGPEHPVEEDPAAAQAPGLAAVDRGAIGAELGHGRSAQRSRWRSPSWSPATAALGRSPGQALRSILPNEQAGD